jgi:hypothetical protein
MRVAISWMGLVHIKAVGGSCLSLPPSEDAAGRAISEAGNRLYHTELGSTLILNFPAFNSVKKWIPAIYSTIIIETGWTKTVT